MQATNKNIDQLFNDKANAYKADNSFAALDFANIKANLPTGPTTIVTPRKNPTSWFSLNTMIGLISIVAISVIVFFTINNKSNITVNNTPILNLNDSSNINDTPVIVYEIPKDPKTAPKKWVYKMQINFDKKTNTNLPVKQFIDLSDVKPNDNDLNNKFEIIEGKKVIQNFISKMASPAQIFSINNQEPHTITCTNGTVLKIKSNTFISLDKKTIQGNVALEIKEAYSYTDMIANNLHTVSNGNLLQSGGMVYINATQNIQQLDIDIQNPIQVEMPTTKKKEGMLLFNLDNNNWVANGQWQNISPKKIKKEISELDNNNFNDTLDGFNQKFISLNDNKYVFSLRNLKWINCDAFSSNKVTNIYVNNNVKSKANLFSSLILRKFKGIIKGFTNSKDVIVFNNVPKDTEIIILSFKIQNDKVFTCIKKLFSNEDLNNIEDFIELSPTQVKAKLDALGTVQ